MSNLLGRQFQKFFNRTFRLLLLSSTFIGTLACINCQSATAQVKNEKPTGSSHRNHRAAGINAIPFAEINANAQKRIKEVVNRPSFYRRLPVQSIDADPEYFRLLVRRPELIVSIWQLMGVTKMSAERTGPFSIKTNDGGGTISDLELIYGNDKLHVFYGNGSYTGPMLKQKLSGRCVIVLQTQATETSTGYNLTNVLDVYLRVDNTTASIITRTIQPIVGSTADHNFTESLKFVQRLNQSTRANGPGVKGMGRKLDIDAQVRKDFESVVDRVFERAIQKSQRLLRGGTTPNRVAVAKKTSRPQPVQVSKPPTSAKPVAGKRQPVVTSGLLSNSTPGKIAPATKRVAITPAPPQLTTPATVNLNNTSSLPGFSVLVGGPRDIIEPTKPFVSIAGRNRIANPKYDPTVSPRRSAKR